LIIILSSSSEFLLN